MIIAPSGRKYYRHYSDKGSVMCWNDNGVERETLILDMKYHNVRKNYGPYGEDVSSGVTNYITAPFKDQPNNHYILGSESVIPSDYDGQTDDILNAKFNWTDERTSKQNTDALIAAYPNEYFAAANYCGSILLNGAGFDLPNMQTLVRIFCDRATIHLLDKSDVNNRWSSWFGNNFALSSSGYSEYRAWNVGYDGGVYDLSKYLKDYIVPVKDVWEKHND